MVRSLFSIPAFMLLGLLFWAVGAAAHGSTGIEENREPTGVAEKGGNLLPLEARFQDENGEDVRLGDIITRPTLLLPVYYNCPRSCSFDMANLALALQQTRIDPGTFSVITMSFDEEETAGDAAKAKSNYTNMLKGRFPTDAWHFLTGDKHNIDLVTQSIGYNFNRSGGGLFVHPSAMVAIGADGKIIKYVYGSFLSGDVDLALSEAATGTPATSIRRFLNYCLTSSPERNEKIFQIMKVSIIFLLCLGAFLLARLLRNNPQ